VFLYLFVFQLHKKYDFYVNRIQKNCLKLQKVAVVSKMGSKESEQAAKNVVKKLLGKKSIVYTISPIEVKGAKKIETLEELKKIKLDLVITLGGDGTTLRVFRSLENETPILTINVGGNRGILSEITIEQIDETINQILKNKFFLDKRTRVVASCGGKEFPPALNEIYISRTNLTKTAEIKIKFQNDIVKQKMDGVIIATPSGSTGHSFSLGGPILHESLDVLIITPVAPVYRLESIVVPDEKIEITCSHDCNIVMDAQVIKAAGYEEPIIIKKYKKPAVFVRLKKRGLRQMSKLGF
jgi:NAD+ kinase